MAEDTCLGDETWTNVVAEQCAELGWAGLGTTIRGDTVVPVWLAANIKVPYRCFVRRTREA
jgi:hypothetical protein